MAATYKLGPQPGSGPPKPITPGLPPAPGKPAAGPAKPPEGVKTASPMTGGAPSAPTTVITPRPPVPPRPSESAAKVERLTSLDAFRGFIMVLLAASGFGILPFSKLPESAEVWHRPVVENGVSRAATDADVQERRTWWKLLGFHFDHPAWRSDFLVEQVDDPASVPSWKRVGVSFWDLIQPAFMFMVGAAMPFSYRRRSDAGEPLPARAWHALMRAVVLVLLGVFLYSTGADRTNWIFTNVLAQIGLGYFFVYLLLGFRWWVQFAAMCLILGGYWYFMQTGYWQWTGTPRPTGTYDHAAVMADPAKGEVLTGEFAPWSKNDNAAHAVDLRLLNSLRDPDGQAMAAWREQMKTGELSWGEWLQMTIRRCLFAETTPFQFNNGGYQTLNFIPSIATMLLGVLMGQLLQGKSGAFRKLFLIFLTGLLCLVAGRLLGTYACPIVKRIWTPSWALFSGAYVIWMLGVFYFLFDVLPLKWFAFPLTIVGMNSIVMYMMGQLMRPFTTNKVVEPHLTGLIETIFGTDPVLDGKLYLLGDEMFGRIILPCASLAVFWMIAFWLWRRRLFVRI
jgi:heparan-alpha-glucosaminide N-acetyltransferase